MDYFVVILSIKSGSKNGCKYSIWKNHTLLTAATLIYSKNIYQNNLNEFEFIKCLEMAAYNLQMSGGIWGELGDSQEDGSVRSEGSLRVDKYGRGRGVGRF